MRKIIVWWKVNDNKKAYREKVLYFIQDKKKLLTSFFSGSCKAIQIHEAIAQYNLLAQILPQQVFIILMRSTTISALTVLCNKKLIIYQKMFIY